MLDRIRQRLTVGYVGILALILVLFGAIVVISFSRQITAQQDELLAQKAEAEASSLLSNGETYGRITTTTESDIAVVAVPADGSTGADFLDLGSSASSLGLPFGELAQRAAREDRTISETVQGPEGAVRVVSMPLFGDSGETLAVVQAAQSRRVVRETVDRLILVLASVGLGALVLASMGGLYMSRRAVRPVREAFDRQRAFIADASHELKTPLALIKIKAEVLSRDPAAPDNREIIEGQLSEIDRMNGVLSDLLLLTRLDTGKLTVSRKPFDLAMVIVEAVARFEARAAAEGTRLGIEAPGELPALGDRVRTEQILAVLLDNALTYTPKEGSITVTGRARDGFVETTVQDSGPGIAAEHLPRIFERFYRADPARSRTSGGGTGLGLAIARDLARAQEGDLEAENAKGGGALFRLTLPKGEAG